MYEKALKSYEQMSYLTAEPLKLVLLCYKGAIGSLKVVKEAYATNDYEQKAKALKKTIDIISELNSSLDMEKGGQIARNLRSLYNFMTQALIEADLKRNIAMFDKIIALLEELEMAWEDVGTLLVTRRREPEEQIGPGTAGITKNVFKPVLERAWNA